MTRPSEDVPPPQTIPAAPAWFCLRTQARHEHIAAAHLHQDQGIEVFLPRVRFRRATRQGGRFVTEALFPCYLFARFDWHHCLRQVRSAQGVRQIVHFGYRWPTIPDGAIEELRAEFGAEEIHEIPGELKPGTPVKLLGGAFHGLLAVVSRPLPARHRVAVLMEFLGRQTCVEVDESRVIREGDPRSLLS